MLPMLAPSKSHIRFLRRAARATATIGSSFPYVEKVDGVTHVTDAASAERALTALRRCADVVAWDTETSGVDLSTGLFRSRQGRVVCATAYAGEDVDFGNGPRLLVDNRDQSEGPLALFRDYFEDPQHKKVFHNFAFDRHMLKREGCAVQGLEADTLMLARIHDTAKSSWEGVGRATMQKQTESMEKAYKRGQLAPTYPVTGLFFAGQRIDPQALSACLHTVALPAVEDSKHTLPRMTSYGYDLKSLATTFGLVETDQTPQRFPFGASRDAALQAFSSQETFPKFVEYATLDAVLTFRLFQHLKLALSARPWSTEVQKLSVSELLCDSDKADAIAAELRNYVSARTKAKTKPGMNRSLAGTPGTVQLHTGKTMWDLYKENLQELPECLATLQDRGVGVDTAALKHLEERAGGDLDETRQSLREKLKAIHKPDGSPLSEDMVSLNINSAQQLQTLLFGGACNKRDSFETVQATRSFPAAKGSGKKTFSLSSLGLQPGKKKADFTDKGWPSTSKDALARLRSGGEVRRQLEKNGFSEEATVNVEAALSLLASCKQIETNLRTLKGLQQAVVQDRIHPVWQFATSTGRLTCSQPNLHSLVSGQKDVYGIRSAFKAKPGCKLVLADYSQLELRILAHIAKCRIMREGLQQGGDYHAQVAAEMFPHVREAVESGRVSLDNASERNVKSVFPEERRRAKAVNFGVMYGMSESTFAEDLDISLEEAASMMQAWFHSKPAVQSWKRRVEDHAQQEQVSLSLLGRERHLPLLDDQASHFHRQRSMRAAVNFAIQGSSADIVTAAMIQLEHSQALKEMGFHLIMQVHDELILEGPEEHAEKAAEILRETMMAPFKEINPGYEFQVPLEVNITIGDTLQAKA